MRLRKSLVALAAVVGTVGGVGLAATPASADPIVTCGHYNVYAYPWFTAYLRHSTTPYGVHYHYYRDTNVVTGASHTHSRIC